MLKGSKIVNFPRLFIFLALMQVGSATLARADAVPVIPIIGNPSLDGMYAGANMGLNWDSVNAIYEDNFGDNQQKTKKYGMNGGAFGGYLMEIGATRTLIGAETNIITSTVAFSKPFGAGPNTYGIQKTQRRQSVAISTVFGKLFNMRTFLFGKVGGEYIYYNVNLQYNDQVTTPAFFQGKTRSFTTRFWGLLLGIGLDYLVLAGFAIGVEYNYTAAMKKKRIDVDTSAPVPPNYYLKPKEQKIMFRFSYRV